MSPSLPPARPSYQRAQGQLTPGQRHALRELWPQYGLTANYGDVLDLDAAFGRQAPRALDIGFGHGETLIARAQAQPDHDVLGVEVHRPGLGAALRAIEHAALPNVRIVRHDALTLLEKHVPDHSFSSYTLFFPDPWTNPLDAERRLFRPALLSLLAARARPGATLTLVTDIADYAAHADAVAAEHPAWLAQPALPPVWLPHTHYAERAREAGRALHHREYRLTDAQVPT